ncbi:MAG: Holliday junction resolvase RuvX [Saprospiraceae bacterium]|nr:Holliday junction resolvase RuvX [Saprospiraceae bacterium]
MRVLGIDYGAKKTGLAVTDPLQIIASGLETVATGNLTAYLKKYIAKEPVSKIVIGYPRHPDGNPAQLADTITAFGEGLRKDHPGLEIVYQDESYTSSQARDIILRSGIGKKKRRDKTLVDKISAVLILQAYLQHI